MFINIPRIFIILSAVILLSCFNKKKKEYNKAGISDSYTFSLNKASKEDFSNAKQNKVVQLISDTSILTYRNESLCLPSTCSDSICLRSSRIDPIPIKQEYIYQGFLKSVNQYVLEKFHEGYSSFLLIEKCNNGRTELWGYPTISPDSAKVACFASFVTGSTPNGIQVFYLEKIYNTKGQYLVKKVEINQKFWRPLDLVWENEKSILIKVENFDYEKDQTPSFLRLILNE